MLLKKKNIIVEEYTNLRRLSYFSAIIIVLDKLFNSLISSLYINKITILLYSKNSKMEIPSHKPQILNSKLEKFQILNFLNLKYYGFKYLKIII